MLKKTAAKKKEKPNGDTKSQSLATRLDEHTLDQLKKLFPNESPSQILRILVEERIAVHRNTMNLYAARKGLMGRQSERDLL